MNNNLHLTFRPVYFILTVLLFVAEVLIALCIRDRVIRPYAGDFLVVILIYCFFRSFFKIKPVPLAISVLLFACSIETLQYFQIVEVLGWEDSRVARTILGSVFEWLDILVYTAGILVVLITERLLIKRKNRH